MASHVTHSAVFEKKKDCIISQFNKTNLQFETLTCILVLYDCLMIPFNSSFGSKFWSEETEGFFFILDQVFRLVFFIDVALGFFRAYPNPLTGIEIRSHRLIAINYLKFHFWLDFVPVLPFEVLSNNQNFRMLKLFKLLRLLLKLTRIMKLKKLISF